MKGYPGWAALFQPSVPGRSPRRTIVFHGTADRTVHPASAERISADAVAGLKTHTVEEIATSKGGRAYTRTSTRGADGALLSEVWLIDGSEHAWSGGSPDGSFTDPLGRDASAEMLRFFLQHNRVDAGVLRRAG